MNVLVDTSVWSLALRRDHAIEDPAIDLLTRTLTDGNAVTTGVILQEILQGIRGPKTREAIIERFAALPCLAPERSDHLDAAEMHTACRHAGVQATTIDVLLAALCVRYDLTLLTKDRDFEHIARSRPFEVQGLG